MKIIHISHLYHPSQGGVQTFFKNISERLVRDYGDDVTVVTTNSIYGPERMMFKSAGPREEVINGVKVIRFAYRRWHIKPFSFLSKAFKKLTLTMPEKWVAKAYGPYSPAMKKYLLNVDAEVFCASSSNYYFMQLPLWRKCFFFYYGSIHLSEDNKKGQLHQVQVDSMNASSLYLANTDFERKRLIQMGVQREKVFVLGTGVEMKPFLNVSNDRINTFRHELQIPENGLLVGYVGRIEITKNVLTLIKAFEKISSRFDNVFLLIAGSGNSYVEQLKEYCETLPQPTNSRIKWQVNFLAELKPLIFNCLDIFVLPSHNESFGLVFLEAWSCKKPVIGAAIGAVRSVISDGLDGLLMSVNDSESLSEKLAELICNKELRITLGKNGFEKVKNNYTWDIIVARLRQCYLDALVPSKKAISYQNV